MHGSEIIHLRYKNTPENTKHPINKMASEMASSKHRVSMTFTSKIQANNINNKKSYLIGQYHSRLYWQRIGLVKIWRDDDQI